MDSQNKTAPIHFLICLHTQSTCDQSGIMKPCQQTIQIDALVVDIKSVQPKVVNKFYKLIKPHFNPKLTQFCTKITGLTNKQLQQRQKIITVIQQFDKWLKNMPGISQNNYTFVSWGSWTFKSGLIRQLAAKNIKKPLSFNSYTDLKRTFTYHFGQAKNIYQAAKILKIQLEKNYNLTRSQSKNLALSEILISLLNHKQFSPQKKYMTQIQDLSKVNTGQHLQFLLVLDFQATCQQNIKLKPCSQIIQFPVMVIDLNAQKIISQFHYYITPVYHPKITKFCTELTGITQEMVDKKPKLEQVLNYLDKWIQSQKYLADKNFAFVTCGDWDLATCLKYEAKVKNIDIPQYLKSYINIKKVFMQNIPKYDISGGMMGMLKALEIPHQGRHHSGIDDVRNICNICIGLINKTGYKFTKKDVIQVK